MNFTWLYVAAVYALAVWMARRSGIDLPWRIAALFYALVLIFLFRPMTGAYVNLPVDFLRVLPPWTYIRGHHHVFNNELNDLTLQIVPWAHQVRESWKSLAAPLWNANSGAGYPLLGNGQSSALSLIRLIALPLTLGHSFTAEAAMKFLIALTFAFLYCRRRGYSELASTIGALSFGFGTFVTVWLHFPLVTVACFLPAVFYALDLLVEKRTYGRFVFAAAIWTLMLFGGHPETVAHVFFLALLNLAWILAVERPFATWRQAGSFIAMLSAVFVVAALLASPFLAPLAESITKSKRFQELKVSPNDQVPYSDFPSAVVLFEPHFYGDVPAEIPWGPAHAESISGFAGVLGVAAWFGLLIDCIARRRFRSREFFLVLVTPVILGIILDWQIVSAPFHAVFSFVANARLRLLFTFILAVQAAAVADLAARGRTLPLAIGVLISSALGAWLFYSTQYPAEWMKGSALLGLLPSLVVLAVAAIVVVGGRNRDFAMMLLVVAVVAELWKVGGVWNPVLPEKMMYPQTPLIDAMDRIRLSTPNNSPFRIVGSGAVFFPNSPAMYGLEDIRTHDPMSNGRYVGVLRVLTGYDTSDYFAKWDNIDTPLLNYLNVRYLITPKAAELKDRERWALRYDGGDGRIFQNRDALERFFVTPVVVPEFSSEKFIQRLMHNPDWSRTAVLRWLPVESDRERDDLLSPRPPGSPEAKLTILSASDTLYVMRIEAPRHTLISSSVPWWPGWRVRRNGERYTPLQVNGAFLGFIVKPGTTVVSVHYAPNSFRVGALISLLTLVLLAALSRESLRRRLLPAAERG